MTIKAQDVKELREKTGLGMMECKKALEEAKAIKEQAQMTKEFEKVDLDTEFDKQVKEKIKKKNIEWSNPK